MDAEGEIKSLIKQDELGRVFHKNIKLKINDNISK